MGSYESSSSDVRLRPGKPGLVVLALLGVVASLLLFRSSRSTELSAASHEFELEASRRIARVHEELLANGERFRSLEALYASSLDVDAEEFRTFAARSLEHTALRAVVSITPVARAGAPDSFFVGFRVGSDAGRLPDDLASEPRFLEALRAAREHGGESVSGPVSLAVDEDVRVLVVRAVFNRHREAAGLKLSR